MKKRFIMEYLECGRTQQIIYADTRKEANKIAAGLAKLRGITEYSVRVG
jgi:long-subunit acyl-CoA synthetase (AMP-forming)